MQDVMIEHKFPANHIAEHEYQLSNAGDIYRSMTESSPDYGYIGPKLDSLTNYINADNTGDFREYKQLMRMPGYKQKRDKYLANLAMLKTLTVTSYVDLKRKDVMLDALELIRGIVLWFESGRVHNPPRRALEKLTSSLEKFFPAQTWIETAATSNPGSNPASAHNYHRKYRFWLRMMEGIEPHIVTAPDISAASEKLAKKLDVVSTVLANIMDEDITGEDRVEIWNPKDSKWVKARAFWEEDEEPYSWEKKFAGSNPADPVIPYWVLPAAFTVALVVVSFAGWVASQIEQQSVSL